jgi:hypothetical protein
MTTMGKNVKLTVAKAHRDAIGAIFAEALGATRVVSDAEKDIYRVGDGNVGVFLVDEAQALTPAQARLGAWLEFFVDDPKALRGPLAKLGAERFAYGEGTFDFYALPGGQVFRLAPTAAA